MRIHRLDLIAYGRFEHTSLDFSHGENGLHVIYGDNEDGKSTTLRAIRGLLFGIEERTRDTFRFKPSQLRVGGCLSRSSGEELSFVRRKGRKATLLHPETGEPLSEEALSPFLGGLTPQLFETLYGIDHDELVSGGKAILEQTGDVGKALYAAATGTTSLKKLLERLERDADALFRPRAPTSRVYTLAREHTDHLREAREATLPSSVWTRLRRELDEATRLRKGLEEERRRLERERKRLERIRRIRPAVAQHRRLRTEIEQLGAVVDLPEDFEQRRSEAMDSKRAARERLDQIASNLERLAAEIGTDKRPPELLSHASTIERLQRKLGSWETARGDRPGQDTRRRQYLNDARELLRTIQPGLDLKDVESLRPLLALKQSVETLVSGHEQLASEELRASSDLREAGETLAALERRRARVEEHPEPVRLAAAVARAQRAGDLDDQIQTLRERCAEKGRQWKRDFDRIGLWQGTVEAFEQAPFPDMETVEDFDSRFQAVEEKIRTIGEKIDENTVRQAEIEEAIKALEREGSVPTEAALRDARAHRDHGWRLVRRQCYENEAAEADIRRYTNGRLLPDVYEGAVERADAVSDRLRKDAGRVQQHQLHAAESKKLENRLRELHEALEAQTRQKETLRSEWQRVWAPSRIEPHPPRPMAAWLHKAEALRQRLDGLRGDEQAHAALLARRTDLCGGLRKELAALASAPDAPAGDLLGTAVDHALRTLETIRSTIALRRELDKELEKARTALEKAKSASTALQARRTRWQGQWDEICKEFVFLSDVGTARVVATLEKLDALFRAMDKANDAKRRIYGIDKRISEFEAEVALFATTAGRPRGEEPVDQYVVGLNEALNQARQLETRRQGIRQQETDLESERTDLRARVRSADDSLSELRAMAGVENDDALIEAGRRSTRARDLRNRLAQQERQIIDAGDGHSVAELEAQTEGVDGDDLSQQIDRHTERLETVEKELRERLDHEAGLKQRVAAKDGTATAAEANEKAALTLSRLREEVRSYLRLRCAALILNNHIDRYRQENQAPVLKRAGELFSRLTLGSFKGLRDELDRSGRPVLMGVRPDDMEVGVDGMSDGTRDQLYLALRLATLERHIRRGEPIPLIVDDILVGFDDDRTESCLQILAKLVHHTQVLLFTHHHRVVQIARAVGDDHEVFIHTLDSDKPRRRAPARPD